MDEGRRPRGAAKRNACGLRAARYTIGRPTGFSCVAHDLLFDPMLSQLAYKKLTQMIYGGQLQPGDRLVERQLARRLGISRIPLRESLARLQSEGLVRTDSHHATYVEDFGPQDALEIYSMRLLFEPFAAQLAAERRLPQLIKRLKSLMQKMKAHAQRGHLRKLNEADYAFHLSIVQAAGLKRLTRAYESCHIRIFSPKPSESRDYSAEIMAWHQRIATAIERGRGEDARKAAYDHVWHAMERIKKEFCAGSPQAN